MSDFIIGEEVWLLRKRLMPVHIPSLKQEWREKQLNKLDI